MLLDLRSLWESGAAVAELDLVAGVTVSMTRQGGLEANLGRAGTLDNGLSRTGQVTVGLRE
jgi:hypothetical protein